MKWLKLLVPMVVLASSCTTTVIIEDPAIEETDARSILSGKDLWYIDIHASSGEESENFMQIAFTLTFDRGTVMANNNLRGIGDTGNGLGIPVGFYTISGNHIEVEHQIDGLKQMRIEVADHNKIVLVDLHSGASYTLYGYDLNEFDFQELFYDNLHYFLQEYELWEKTLVSEEGAVNDFDAENFLRFFDINTTRVFESSTDHKSVDINNIYWDYSGAYQVYDIAGEPYVKTLTLDYEIPGNDYFEIYVLNKSTIELFHPPSGTVYEFTGRLPVQYLKSSKETENRPERKLRRSYKNPVMKVKRQGEHRSFEII